MKGGVVTKISAEPIDLQIQRIIRASVLSTLSNGSYGYTISVQAPHDFDTGFMNFETNEMARHFILKVVPIDVFMAYRDTLPIDKENYSRKTTEAEFHIEPQMLQYCYEESLKRHHTAICPAMLHSTIYTVEQLESFMGNVYAYASGYSEPDTPLTIKECKDSKVGILFMECAPGKTLYKYLKEHPQQLNDVKRKSLGLYCTAIDCGVDHNDPNLSNIMIDKNGNLTLIDFGLANRIKHRELYHNLIAKSIESKNYSILKELLSRDAYKEGKLLESYEWFFEEPFEIGEFITRRLTKETVTHCLKGSCPTPIVSWESTDVKLTPDSEFEIARLEGIRKNLLQELKKIETKPAEEWDKYKAPILRAASQQLGTSDIFRTIDRLKVEEEMKSLYFQITGDNVGAFTFRQSKIRREAAQHAAREAAARAKHEATQHAAREAAERAEREALHRAQLAAALEEEKRAAEKHAVEKRAADLKAERAARKRATQERAEAIRTKRRTERDLFGKLTEKNRSLIRHFATPSSNPLKNATVELEEEIIKLIGHLPSLEEIEADLNKNVPTQRLIQTIKEKTPNEKMNEIYRIFIRKHRKPRGGTRKHKKH